MSFVAITNVNVFDGVSPDLLENATVVIEDGVIREVGQGPVPSNAQFVVKAKGKTLIPGLIDCHTHVWIADVQGGRAAKRSTEYLASFAVRSLERSLNRGFTAMRDAGGSDPSFVTAIENGLIRGPRFYPAGRSLSQTGGHGDRRIPGDENWDLSVADQRFNRIVDSPDDMRKAVRQELARGARQIKLMLSGGVTSHDPLEPVQFSDEEIAVAVEETSKRGAYVFAHCHSLSSVKKALETGIRTIEHASYLDEATARAIAEKGTFVVPTPAVAKALRDDVASTGYAVSNLKKLNGLYEAMMESIGLMKRAGVMLGYGTDLLGHHQDMQFMGFEIMREIFTPHEILVSATSVGGRILQEDGRLGVVKPGAHADLLLVDSNPLKNLAVFESEGKNLSMIMKGGTVHKLVNQ
ncbi:amidohydrolase family protein [Bradyrhizobium pachyrhizi]|uniref:metal-dependent hydrolase family protein n=1 Tax=Bradyrhizobium pachyrhizi TaxID=280333 RepID=UPI003D36C207